MSGRWNSTRLYEQLRSVRGGDADSLSATLMRCMPDVEHVLDRSATSPKDFTLHDAGHAYRVANLMVQCIPDDVFQRLSEYELALLLLAAYLHDVGMTPSWDKVKHIRSHLLFGKRAGLPEHEAAELQRWLDDECGGIEIPLASEIQNVHLAQADELTAYYCRRKHNEWSAEFIDAHLSHETFGAYTHWLTDLKALCHSHHDGFNDLLHSKFDPIIVGHHFVHLRYLACVLRIADILEFDPERTPDVVLQHRDISPNSVLFWHKDHEISLLLTSSQVLLFARPTSAYIQKALEEMVQQINDELALCRMLDQQRPFSHYPGWSEPLPYRWDLPRSAAVEIRPVEGSYEYIEGAFRPDTRRLLELLGGTALYGDPIAAVRELLQNAFDAVKEDIAHSRLAASNPLQIGLEEALSQQYRVQLITEDCANRRWLVCKDNGAGMTKAIIEHGLLVSGRTKRHDILALERKCIEAGFALGRTGQFGIGVLSYFMIADRVLIRTCRSQATGDTDLAGWEFVCDGIGSFGELKRETDVRAGTEVRLRLRPEFQKTELSKWNASLYWCLRKRFSRIPCRFQLLSGNDVLFEQQPGWTMTERDIWNGMLPLPSELKERIDPKNDEAIRSVLSAAKEALHVVARSGTLASNSVAYRISIPYFALPGGACLLYLQTKNYEPGCAEVVVSFGPGAAKERVIVSWNGTVVHDSEDRTVEYSTIWGLVDDVKRCLPGGIVEIDFQASDVGSVSIKRNSMELNQSGLALGASVTEVLQHELEAFCEKHVDSLYSSISECFLKDHALQYDRVRWLFQVGSEAESDEQVWSKVEFPVMALPHRLLSANLSLWRAAHRGRPIVLLQSPATRSFYGGWGGDLGLPWEVTRLAPDHVALYPRFPSELSGSPKGRTIGLSGIFTGSTHSAVSGAGRLLCDFPPSWNSLVGVDMGGSRRHHHESVFWGNPANRLIVAETEISRQWINNKYGRSMPLKPVCDELLNSRSRVATWVLECLFRSERKLWQELMEKEPAFLSAVWDVLGLSDACPWVGFAQVAQFSEGASDRGIVLHTIAPHGWKRLQNDAALEYLTLPAQEWWVAIEPRAKLVEGSITDESGLHQ